MPELTLRTATPPQTKRQPTTNQGATIANTATMDLPRRLIANGLNLDCLRTQDTFQYEDWKTIDRVVQETLKEELVGTMDLMDNDLVHPLGGLGSITTQWSRMSEMNAAELSMWADMDAEQGAQVFDQVELPVPCIFKEFQLSIRVIENSRRLGDGLDVLGIRAATRVVSEAIESMLFNGNTTVYGNLPIYGYRTHPSRNTVSGGDWGTVSNAYTNLSTALSRLDADNSNVGQIVVYVNPTQFRELDAFVDASHTLSARQLILQSLSEITAVKKTSAVPAGEAIMVALRPETVDMAVAEIPNLYEWPSMGGLRTHYRVLGCMVPRIKADFEGRSGIVHISGI